MTLDGEKETTKDALPSKEGQPSTSEKISPSEPAPKVYSEEQLAKLMDLKHSTLDKQISTLGKDLKESQLTVEKKESELADIAEDKKKLQNELDELARDDPDKLKVVQKLKTLDELEKSLKADRQTLETDKQTHQESIKLASDTLREISIWKIATEYEGGDPVKLKEFCDKFNVSSEEQVRVAADTIWSKKPVEPGTPSITPDSGMTSGGGEKTEDQKLKERYPTMK